MESTRTSRGRRLLGLAVAGLLGVLTAAAAPASAVQQQSAVEASARVAEHKAHAKPTVVMVHGAWADASGWDKVTRRLLNDGYAVRNPPNPLRGLASDAETISDFLSTLSGPIVLVGHSYGGAVITNAATGNENVRALVYVDAFAPAEGETIFPLAGADSALNVDPATVFDFVPYPGAPQGDVDLYLKHSTFLDSFATGVPRPQAELLYTSQRPLTLSAGFAPSGRPAWETIPSWYVLGTRDEIITPTAQQFMAERAGSTITRVRAGHLSMLTAPRQVTAVIEQAARATD